MTALDLAKKLEMSERSILAFETGGFQPSKESLEKIASLMGEEKGRVSLMFRLWRRSLE